MALPKQQNNNVPAQESAAIIVTRETADAVWDAVDALLNGTAVITEVSVGNGTAAAPSMTFTSDQDLGIYRIGANNLGISANGAKVVDVATTGVGVTGVITASTTITATTGIIVGSGTQIGSDSPTISTPSGIITTATTATAPQAYKTVTLTNTLVTTSTKCFVSIGGYGGTGIPVVAQVTTSANTVTIKILNAQDTGGSNLSAAMDLYFFIVN